MNNLTKRLIRFSATIQFVSGKASLLFSTITLATVLSMKFHVYFPLVVGGIVVIGLVGVFIVVKSGWYKAEMDYVGKKMLDRKDE